MVNPLIALPSNNKTPLQVHVNRNGFKESLHEVDVAVCDADGKVILGMGDQERVVFPRSAMKPLQAIALVELLNSSTDIPEFSKAEIALICASHNGETIHTEAVTKLLGKFDISIDELICGAHWSMHQETMISQVRRMDEPHKVHNNCSGKHAGMLILSKLMNGKTAGYADLTNMVQQRILGTLEFMTGLDLMQYTHGIDGCGAPVFSAPLGNWARAFALFSSGGELPETKHEACQRIRTSIAAEPLYIAGHDRACSAINSVYGEAITVKTGAEGVYSAAFHELGLGTMVKARDGNKRGAEVAIGAVIRALGYPTDDLVKDFFRPKLLNWAGEEVGDITVPQFL
ncbi:asparaginase [Rhodospirillaceae bacterium]|jgi:L-asparaginase II|nr:asparaginase [Rhodospirillaceae bacterium]MBT6305922.1 asparaginase [Rhodospirillaceae bacterium]MBT7731567.1 asparaginase [Rhodospirillaceae bacterium]MDC1442859.1 asparaginase [Rhodospirillaceae bacterium]